MLPRPHFLDGIIRQGNRRQAFAVKAAAPAGKIKAPVGKAGIRRFAGKSAESVGTICRKKPAAVPQPRRIPASKAAGYPANTGQSSSGPPVEPRTRRRSRPAAQAGLVGGYKLTCQRPACPSGGRRPENPAKARRPNTSPQRPPQRAKIKIPVDKAGPPPIRRQIRGILRGDIQEKAGRRIRRRAGFPQINQLIILNIQVKIGLGGRGNVGQSGVSCPQGFRVDRQIYVYFPPSGLPGADSGDGIVRQRNRRQALAVKKPPQRPKSKSRLA